NAVTIHRRAPGGKERRRPLPRRRPRIPRSELRRGEGLPGAALRWGMSSRPAFAVLALALVASGGCSRPAAMDRALGLALGWRHGRRAARADPGPFLREARLDDAGLCRLVEEATRPCLEQRDRGADACRALREGNTFTEVATMLADVANPAPDSCALRLLMRL